MDDAVPLAFIFVVGLLLVGMGLLIARDNISADERFQQCIAAGMQWHRGDCIR